LCGKEKNMGAYLYTWNPNRWDWSDLQDAIFRVNNGKQYDMYWSCGNTKRIDVRDRFFLMRLGIEPKGIIACGYVLSKPYLLPHWDEEKAKAGEESLRTDLLFQALASEPSITLTQLQEDYPNYKWTPQVSGLSIPDNISEKLWSLIQTDSKHCFREPSKKEIECYLDGKPKEAIYRTYDRSSAARQDCIEHFGYKCSVCAFDFGEAYGALGAGYIEVHHLKPVSESMEEHLINPVDDLRPVCANCHRMLHKSRPPLSIKELQTHLQGNRDTDR
jgi:5-methylcytosine-specific restriction enzyme A